MDDDAFIREFQALVSDVRHMRESMAEGFAQVKATITEHRQANDARVASLEAKVAALEKWRYLLMGASLAGGAVAGGAGQAVFEAIAKVAGG